jgi:hypothetical protein
MPPSKSGIADYSEALSGELAQRVSLTLFDQSAESGSFDPCAFDVALYHIGNNPWHTFVYEQALRHPGVVVMHEAICTISSPTSRSGEATGTPIWPSASSTEARPLWRMRNAPANS